MHKRLLYSLLFISLTLHSNEVASQSVLNYHLPESLKEISGLEELNDSVLVAINDGGNKAELTLINKQGELIKRVKLLNAENKDWEDLARDDEFLYVGDFGNNLNSRKDLCIYKVRIKSILESETVEAKKISFSYNEQKNFPPSKTELRFDCEALISYENKLVLFTKTNTSPWDGKSWMYSLPKEPGSYTLTKENEIFIGDDGWLVDAITAADYYEGTLYLLTYNRILEFNYAKNKPIYRSNHKFEEATQKESIVIIDSESKFVADEYHRVLGGGKLYRIEHKK